MTDLTADDVLASEIARDLEERERVSKLTNAQLVEEMLNTLPFTEFDALIEEACTRLDPTWQEREPEPLTPEAEEMLRRCHERFRQRLDEVLSKRKERG